MKINIIQVSRSPRWPLWAVLVALLWLALGGAVNLLAYYFNQPTQLCLFKLLTGIPCPTCGFTRGGLTLLQGHAVQAWLYNPLLFSVLTLFSAALAGRLLFSRAIRIHLTHRERIIALVLAVMLFSINWAYVILYTG